MSFFLTRSCRTGHRFSADVFVVFLYRIVLGFLPGDYGHRSWRMGMDARNQSGNRSAKGGEFRQKAPDPVKGSSLRTRSIRGDSFAVAPPRLDGFHPPYESYRTIPHTDSDNVHGVGSQGILVTHRNVNEE